MHPDHKQALSGRSALYDAATIRVMRELEAGTVPGIRPRPAGLAAQCSTGRTDSGINILILWDAVMTRGFTRQD